MKAFAFHGHTKPVTSIQFSDEGDLLFSASKDGSCAVWNVQNGARLGTYDGHSAIQGLHVNHSSSLLCTAGADFKTIIWSVDSGEKLVQWDNAAPCRSPEFSHDDRFLLQIGDKKMKQDATLFLYELPAKLGGGEEVRTIRTKYTHTQSEGFMSAHWGPTNDTIYFSSDDGSISIFDVETQKELRFGQPHNDEVRNIRFDQNYKMLTTASKDKTSKLLDSKTLKTVATYTYNAPVNDSHLSPRADHVVVGGGVEAVDVTTTKGDSKFAVNFYHAVHETLLGQHMCHFGTINTVLWHPGGHMFASGAHDGFVKLHMLPESYSLSPGYKPIFDRAAAAGDADRQRKEAADAEDGEGEYDEEYYEEGEYDEEDGAAAEAEVDDI